ncbi:MAG: hypothetical protein K9K38_06955 [Rhodoferax sp.]|nr:hypothetical protein [Rhodoferax sp.]
MASCLPPQLINRSSLVSCPAPFVVHWFAPFEVSLSNHKLPFDKLRANGLERRHSLPSAPFVVHWSAPFVVHWSAPFVVHWSAPFVVSLSAPFVVSLSAPFVVSLSAPFVVSLSAPFVVSLSNHTLPFDKLKANGL